MLLSRYLRHVVRTGELTVVDTDGKAHRFVGAPGPKAAIRLHDRSLDWKLFFWPELSCGEAYTEGTLTIEEGSLYDFLDLIGRNLAAVPPRPFRRAAHRVDRLFRLLHQFNPTARARRNASHHYDLSFDLYDLFLDSDRQYSCAYFTSSSDSLDEAQRNKRRHIAAKLLLRPGLRVLDIGCGWGGLAIWMASRLGMQVTGLTLSEEQLKIARARAVFSGLGNQAEFHLRDYREEKGTYDRIVSVGMFEHVGRAYYGRFFDCLRDRLTTDGVALLHTIGRADGPGVTTPWIRKYIFPGGYVPALSELVPAIERAGLWITDIEILRLHYAETLRHWRERFLENRQRASELYDERFCRMWEFYLAGSEIAFRWLGQAVFQIQLSRRQDAVPLTRDYIAETERRLTATEIGGPAPAERAA